MVPSRLPLVAVVIAVLGMSVARPADPITGASAPRWEPREGFVTTPPTDYSVTEEGGCVVFRASGAGRELPWMLTLRDEEVLSDARYLVVEYRSEGLGAVPGNYFMHGWEGTRGGRTYVLSDELEVDGEWHVVAADLVAIGAAGDTNQVALKVVVGDGGSATLTVRRLWFADTLPEGATVSRTTAPAREEVRVSWAEYGPPAAEPAWTTRPATDFEAMPAGTAVAFTVRGSGRQMRWPMALKQPVDLSRLPRFAVRYRASGAVSREGYTIWLGDDASGAGGQSCIPLSPRDLVVDGQWHTFTAQLDQDFTATQLAVGLDATGDAATVTLGPVTFSSGPPIWPVAELLPYEVRADPWPAGRDGWTPLTDLPAPGRPSLMLAARLGVADWFAGPHVTVAGAPFEAVAEAGQAPHTGTAALGAVEISLPPDASEVYVLSAVAAPPTEPFGIDYQQPRPMEVLAEPEKVVCEIRYAEGPPDEMLPIDLGSGAWGLRRGLSVCVVHPDASRRPTALVLHDGMRTADFAILAATVRTDAPRVAEPSWSELAYASPPAGATAALGRPRGAVPGTPVIEAGKLSAAVSLEPRPMLSALRAGSDDGPLGVMRGPLFEVEVDGSVLPADSWRSIGSTSDAEGRWRFTLGHEETGLRATVTCRAGEGDALILGMTLANTGTEARTATLRFPVLRGVRMGEVADTWYLFGRRGGIINRAPVAFREALGEPHPLQVDGFFNPASGLALACMTHDTEAKHHFLNLAKDDTGGTWAPEYVSRDLAPGAEFSASEAELRLCEGDWRAIFGAYRAWLSTWYRPPSEKPWWQVTYAFITRNAHYDAYADPSERGAIDPAIDDCLKYLGRCDYVHLFGWSSSKQYGDWGDYDHYDETVGGRETFAGNIAAAQAGGGVPVGLYLDGYLSSDAGEQVGVRAAEWAMKRPDGTPQYIDVYRAYNQCPYQPGWQDHLAGTYARVLRETGAMGLYVDEYGATDGRWCCHAKDHGHNGYEVPYAGEVAMLKRIREAVGPDVPLYSEYPPAEVSRQYLDGSFTYQALWSADQEHLAPHFIDLPRFAFPEFKQFHIIYYVPTRDGNWWLLKFPFFNGESYNLGQPNLPMYDEAAMALQRRAIEVLCAHREAFASHDVTPLIATEKAGVFANAFRAGDETVYTLYNANGRAVRGPVLRLPHRDGASYEDAWSGRPLTPDIGDGHALVSLELPPKGLGCVVVSSRE